ncbi:hypothetical protein MLD38_001755 [Melastoma candidum]|uniref:Uncharacterized protein n=1 Tax=Melastoma candidum TaxID=119954 RepID=A0ACB9SI62_9MYRT|nr:hypothetical protein MLD38_001755 [Melastoma candidum]
MSGSPLWICQTCELIQLVYPRFCVHRLPVLIGFQSSGQDVRFAFPARVSAITIGRKSLCLKPKCVAYEDETQKTDDEDDDLCPVDCGREFKTDKELFNVLNKAKETNSLVVVDFYRTSCGSCKYIKQGFSKLCKVAGDEQAGVIFLKHNMSSTFLWVMDEYDEQSETAERLRIKAVPLFHFYKNGVLLEAFPTRDKERIVEAIRKYTSSSQRAS